MGENTKGRPSVGVGAGIAYSAISATAKPTREIRGLRVCKNEECGLLQNRDRTGATNIGIRFARLVRGQAPGRQAPLQPTDR
jgi:hypothetical protein